MLESRILSSLDLRRALSDLRFMDQIVIMFFFYEDEQMDRIAKRLDMSIDAVSKIKHRAIEKLRKDMCS